MEIYRWMDFWLYVCILNIFPEQLLRMLGTNVLSIIKTTGVKDTLEDLLGLTAHVPFLWFLVLFIICLVPSRTVLYADFIVSFACFLLIYFNFDFNYHIMTFTHSLKQMHWWTSLNKSHVKQSYEAHIFSSNFFF